MAGREVAISNPDKVFFPTLGLTRSSTSCATTSPSPRARSAASTGGRWRSSATCNGADGEFFFQKRAPESRPEWIETVELRFPSGRTGARDRRPRRGAARVDREPRLHRPEPAPGARGRSRPPRRAARGSRPDAGRRLGADRGGRARVARGAGRTSGSSAGRRRRARAGSTSTRGSSGAGRSARCGARRWRVAREVERRAPAHRHQQVVEGGAPRRVPRLQPEREGPHGRVGLFGAADARRAGLDAADVGRGAGLRPGRVHGRDGAGAVRRARRPVRGDRRRGRVARGAARARRARRGGAGSATRPWPPHYEKTEDEPPRVQPSKRTRRTRRRGAAAGARASARARPAVAGRRRRSSRSRARPRKSEALDGLERWKARHPEVVPHLEPADVHGRRDARPQHDVDPDPRQPPQRAGGPAPAQEPLEVDYDPWEGLRERPPGEDPSRWVGGRVRGKGPMLAKLEHDARRPGTAGPTSRNGTGSGAS